MASDLAILFPGQGSLGPDDRAQTELLAPDLLEKTCELVGEDPFARAAESTRFAQPATACASLARWRALAPTLESPLAFAGHSLGELTALAAAEALDPSDALALVVRRGALMGAAAPGGMTAVRASAADLREVADASGVVVANDNAPGQTVLSGSLAALDAAEALLRQDGLRPLRLKVAGAFHSPLMVPAVTPFAAALQPVVFAEPIAPVLCCASAVPFVDPRAQLPAALTSPVRWREVLLVLHALGARRFVDVGPGRVLAGLVRRTLGTDVEIVEVADVVVA